MKPTIIPPTITEVIVIVENPAVTIIGKIFCSITAISYSDSPTAAAASLVKTIVPGKPKRLVKPTAIDNAVEYPTLFPTTYEIAIMVITHAAK